MKNSLAGFFVLLYFIALLRPVAPFIEYALNKEYIANVLCINKDKPEMQCEGKCHLLKQLKKVNGEERQGNKSTVINLDDYPIGFVKFIAVPLSSGFSDIRLGSYSFIYSLELSYNIFHPPRF